MVSGMNSAQQAFDLLATRAEEPCEQSYCSCPTCLVYAR